MKEPKAENFDEISFDSEDEDFQHEFQTFEEASKAPKKMQAVISVDKLDDSQIKDEESSELNFEHLREVRAG